MLTRRDILKQAGMMAALATTAPWWLGRRAHAARDAKLIVWAPVALAPQVDRLMKEQCFAYAKQAGIKENEVQYSEIGTGQMADEDGGGARGWESSRCHPVRPGSAALYRAQGHLIEVTDVVERMQKVPGGLYDASVRP